MRKAFRAGVFFITNNHLTFRNRDAVDGNRDRHWRGTVVPADAQAVLPQTVFAHLAADVIDRYH